MRSTEPIKLFEAYLSHRKWCGYSEAAAVVLTVSLLHEMVLKNLVIEREPAAGPKRKRAVMVSCEHLPFSAKGNGHYERWA